jgi:polysaccharide biosynthesis/export protein
MKSFLIVLAVAAIALLLQGGLYGQTAAGMGARETISLPKGAAVPLGPFDVVTIHVTDAEEMSDKPYRIDPDGNLHLPMVGQVRAAGLTLDQLESELRTRLKALIRNPDVSASVVEFHSQPVSVIGCVKSPGILQLQGRKTLVEVLSLAGGVSEEAGYTVKITRKAENGRIPLPGAKDDPSGNFSVAEVKLKSLMSATGPEQNIFILPDDVISVPRGQMVYVIGQVMRSGGFVLNERESMSVLQALSLAGGLDRAAQAQNSRILRATAGDSERREVRLDLRKILAGSEEDISLRSDDILFIPASAPKKAALRAVEAAIQLGTGVAIWRR